MSARATTDWRIDATMREIIHAHAIQNARDQAIASAMEPDASGETPLVRLDWLFETAEQTHALRLLSQTPSLCEERVDTFGLNYVYAGTVNLRHGEGSRELHTGEAYWCNPYVPHRIEIADKSCLASFIIRPQVMNTSPGIYSPETGIFADRFLRHAYRLPIGAPIYFPRNDNFAAQIRQRVESIAKELARSQSGWSLFASGEFTCLSILFARSYRQTSGPAAGDGTFPLAELLRYISEGSRDISLQKLADHFNYSPAHMSRLILQHTGRRFAEIVRDLKIERTAKYLAETHLSLDQIAHLVGFSSASYLSQVFWRARHQTPGQFRADQRNQGLGAGS